MGGCDINFTVEKTDKNYVSQMAKVNIKSDMSH